MVSQASAGRPANRRNMLSTIITTAVLLMQASDVLRVSALRIAFLSDSGTGHTDPAKPFVDYKGVTQNEFLINGEPCVDYAGNYCLLESRAADVFAMVKRNNVDLIVHAGDLDYESAPVTMHNFLSEHLKGMDFLATKGNHDSNCNEGGGDAHGCRDNDNKDSWQGGLWDGREGYARYLMKHHPAAANCYGTYGTDYACDYKGIFIAFSSVGVEKPGEEANRGHAEFLRQALARSKAKWKICVWHMTMGAMQVSYKADATGWEVYEICREAGAFIVTGHAHAYSRSYEMKRFAGEQFNHHHRDLQIGNSDYGQITLRDGGDKTGTTGVVVVGTGGYKNEPQMKTARHWAKIYAQKCKQKECFEADKDSASRFGALICDFDSDQNWANCQFKTTGRNDWGLDRFTLISKLENKVDDSLVLKDPVKIPMGKGSKDIEFDTAIIANGEEDSKSLTLEDSADPLDLTDELTDVTSIIPDSEEDPLDPTDVTEDPTDVTGMAEIMSTTKTKQNSLINP